MAKFWRHWCPNGCGKSVIYKYKYYFCERCEKEFTVKEYEQYKNRD